MTKEEAIKYLQQLYPNGGHCWLDEQRIEAIRMAINALQEEPASEDLIDASNNYCLTIRKGYPRVKDETDVFICNAFKHGAQWDREQIMKDDKFLIAIGDAYVDWIDAGINTNDVDPADYIREHLFE